MCCITSISKPHQHFQTPVYIIICLQRVLLSFKCWVFSFHLHSCFLSVFSTFFSIFTLTDAPATGNRWNALKSTDFSDLWFCWNVPLNPIYSNNTLLYRVCKLNYYLWVMALFQAALSSVGLGKDDEKVRRRICHWHLTLYSRCNTQSDILHFYTYHPLLSYTKEKKKKHSTLCLIHFAAEHDSGRNIFPS